MRAALWATTGPALVGLLVSAAAYLGGAVYLVDVAHAQEPTTTTEAPTTTTEAPTTTTTTAPPDVVPGPGGGPGDDQVAGVAMAVGLVSLTAGALFGSVVLREVWA